MSPAYLDDTIECLGSFIECITELRQRRNKRMVYLRNSCHVHGRREPVGT